jgi:hypothetical protein
MQRGETFSDFLSLFFDLDRLARPEEGVSCKQFSSYDRSAWDANRDWGNYLRSSKAEGNVCAEMEGPGCIFRIWSANPSGRLQFFLDGSNKPALDTPMADLFTQSFFPFLDPLAYRISGADSYVPIPYQKSCRIVLRDNHPLYYHFGYKTYPPDTALETFSKARVETARNDVDRVLALLKNPGPEQLPLLYPGDLENITLESTARPGEPAKIFTREGPGRIALLMLKTSSRERHFLRKSLLKIYWDGSGIPAVCCPLGDFFGTSFGKNLYRALPMGMTAEGGYCLFPMPFEEGARIEIVNQGEGPLKVTGRLVLGPLPDQGPWLRFHAGWRRENPCATFDYPILKVMGRGKFVGCALFIDNPRARWWGEGDEKIWIDGEDFPSTFGTGSEDYFGDAWGHRHHIKPFEGCTLIQNPNHGNKTCVYRYHVTDSIPFAQSFKMTIENYAEDVDYTSVAWWYQETWGHDFFQETPLAQRIPKAPKAIGALEAEDLKAAVEDGSCLVMDDKNLLHELSGGRGLLFKGKEPVALTLPVEEEGNYRLHLGLAHGMVHPALEIKATEDMPMRGRVLPGGVPGFLERKEAGDLHLKKGENKVFLRTVEPESPDHGTVLDFVFLEPVLRRPDALEAEEMKILAEHPGRASLEHLTLPWSNGSQLRFEGKGQNAFLELELPVAAEGAYSIGGICTRGAGYGPFTLSVDDELLGEVIPEELGPDPLGTFMLKSCWLKQGIHSLTVSTEYTVGLDCFFLSWRLGIGNVWEGEDLEVVDFHNGEHQIQGLDPKQFSQGKQLWFRGEEESAFIEAALPVAEDGAYLLKVFYCKSWDYGVVALSLDGEPLGRPFDGYSPRIVPSGAVDYGTHRLDKGLHRLRFLLMDKHDLSRGYFMGVDGLTLEKKE